jgi:1,5-anhydro-D-fructose reductase (1,5-anhydro-D-mannitol-forming)
MTVRWGIIGCGDVCEVKSGPAFQRVPNSELVAVMRRNGVLAADYARRHGVSTWYDDAERLIRDANVDAIYIATPPGNHLELALRVAAAGKPAYVEKPMARSHAECVRMIEAFERARLPLFVAYYRRALPRFLEAKAIVESGRLGAITGVSYRYAHPIAWPQPGKPLPWRLDAKQAGAGFFLDLGSHTLDVLDFIFGSLENVVGSAANVASDYAVEDRVQLQFRSKSGALGTASWNFASAVREDRIAIGGTEGELALSTFGQEPLELTTAAGRETFDRPNPPHIQEPLIRSIVEQLEGRGGCPSTGVSAARTSAVMDRALAGYYGSREEGFWADPERWPGRRAGLTG